MMRRTKNQLANAQSSSNLTGQDTFQVKVTAPASGTMTPTSHDTRSNSKPSPAGSLRSGSGMPPISVRSFYTPINRGGSQLDGFTDSLPIGAKDLMLHLHSTNPAKRQSAMSVTSQDPGENMLYTAEEVKERELAKHMEVLALQAEAQKVAGKLKTMHEEYAATLARLERERGELNEKVKKMEEERDDLTQKSAKQTEQLQELEKRLAEYQEKIQKTEEQQAKANASYEEEQRKMVAKMLLLENETGKVQTELAANTQLLAEYKTERDKKAEELGKCKLELQELRSEIARNKEELLGRDARISELNKACIQESEHANIKKELAEINAAYKATLLELETRKKRQTALESELSQKTVEIEQKKSACGELLSRQQELEAKIGQAKSRESELVAEADKLREAESGLQAELEKHKGKDKEYQLSVAECKKNEKQIRGKMETLRKSEEKLKGEIVGVEAENQRMKAEIEQHQDKEKEWGNETEKLRQKYGENEKVVAGLKEELRKLKKNAEDAKMLEEDANVKALKGASKSRVLQIVLILLVLALAISLFFNIVGNNNKFKKQ